MLNFTFLKINNRFRLDVTPSGSQLTFSSPDEVTSGLEAPPSATWIGAARTPRTG